MMRHRLGLALAAAILIIGIAASGGCGKTPAKTVTPPAGDTGAGKKTFIVTIKNFTFTPAKLTIPVESRVKWVNQDSGQHAVLGKPLDSGPINTGEAYSYQFMSAGTFPYHCSIHPYMEGVVVVK